MKSRWGRPLNAPTPVHWWDADDHRACDPDGTVCYSGKKLNENQVTIDEICFECLAIVRKAQKVLVPETDEFIPDLVYIDCSGSMGLDDGRRLNIAWKSANYYYPGVPIWGFNDNAPWRVTDRSGLDDPGGFSVKHLVDHCGTRSAVLFTDGDGPYIPIEFAAYTKIILV